MRFTLDPRLEQDSVFITDLPLCQVRLENVRNFPWLILIPRQANMTEVHQLSEADQHQLLNESSLCAQALLAQFELHKINVGNLGNVVSQLHWHVVGRRRDDDAWPRPVWGFSDTDEWTVCELGVIIPQLAQRIQAT